MKYIFLLVFIFSLSFTAEIDTKLSDETQNQSYFKEIEEQINQSKKNDSKNIDIINTEKNHLKHLVEVSSKKISIEEIDFKTVAKNENEVEVIIKALFYSSQTELKIKNQNEVLNNIQNKLTLLKKRILNITEEDKSFLLTYQLQYAYYRIQKKHIETRINLFNESKNKTIAFVLNLFAKKISTQNYQTQNEIIKFDENIKKLVQQKTAFELELEKEIINEHEEKKIILENKISKTEESIQNELIEKLKVLNKAVIITLANKKDKQYLKLSEEIEGLLENLNANEVAVYLEQNIIIKDIAKKILGNTRLLLNSSLSQSKSFFEEFGKYFTVTIFVFNEKSITVLSILKALFLIAGGFFIGVLYKRWIYKISLKWPNISQMSSRLTANVGYYIIVLITVMISMSSLGIDMSSISLIAGALSIGIGFGLQTVVSNFIAGIILMFERTIRIGDIIEIDQISKGTVTDIRIRSTTIKTFDNIDIVIPNSSFIQNNVTNWTLDDVTRRLHIPFGVAYGTKVEKVKETILKELDESNLVFLRDIEGKAPDIRLENMNASSVDFELLVWIKANDKVNPSSIRSDFLILIYNTLYKYDIEIPFPQLDLHVKENININ